ncbi:MAG: 3'(2'),5'-bisphosphate nucleotidase CysQ [Clostridia bacterium]|nr:3'(2'),5'-bisphosphate nucleotidase CysQ [Clostridia bacterium]
MIFAKELEIAKEAAVKAGNEIMRIYNFDEDMGVEYKADSSPLTKADKASNKIIVEILSSAFPTYAILSEEEMDNKERLENDFCFVVDPLDGTKEFIKRNGQFAVNIALAYKHRAVMGVIYAPTLGELYYAADGYGAFLSKDGQVCKLKVSERTQNIRMVTSASHACNQIDQLIKRYGIKDYVKIGSSLKGCIIAKGDAEVYYRFNHTMEWDTAAMQCIVEQAGGIFKQMDDSPMLYNRENCLNDKGFYIINNIKNKLDITF